MLKTSGGDFHDKLLKVPTLRPALGRGLKIQTQIAPHSCWQEVRSTGTSKLWLDLSRRTAQKRGEPRGGGK